MARLARLSLSPEEAGKMEEQLGRILEHVRQLDRLDTGGVIPTSHAVEMGTPFRDDTVSPFEEKEAILKNAPDRKGDFFRVPRILED